MAAQPDADTPLSLSSLPGNNNAPASTRAPSRAERIKIKRAAPLKIPGLIIKKEAMGLELDLDPWVASRDMDGTKYVVICNQCERTVTLRTGLNVWHQHCEKKHGRSREDTNNLRAQATAAARQRSGFASPSGTAGTVGEARGEGDNSAAGGSSSTSTQRQAALPPQMSLLKIRKWVKPQAFELEIEYDPWAERLGRFTLQCRKCDKDFGIRDGCWRSHCSGVHGRSRKIQEEIVEKALQEALRRYETMPKYEDEISDTESEDGDEDALQSQLNADVSHQDDTVLRRRSIAKNQQPSENPLRRRYLRPDMIKELELDPLAGLPIDDKFVFCVVCDRTVGLGRGGLGTWRQHCQVLHKRTRDEQDDLIFTAVEQSSLLPNTPVASEPPATEKSLSHSPKVLIPERLPAITSEHSSRSPRARVIPVSPLPEPTPATTAPRSPSLLKSSPPPDSIVLKPTPATEIPQSSSLPEPSSPPASPLAKPISALDALRPPGPPHSSVLSVFIPTDTIAAAEPVPCSSTATSSPDYILRDDAWWLAAPRALYDDALTRGFELDPLVGKITDSTVECAECNKLLIHSAWRWHSTSVHHRPWHEQQQFVMHGRLAALRMAGGTPEQLAREEVKLDKQAKSLSNSRSVTCLPCQKRVVLTSPFDMTAWREHCRRGNHRRTNNLHNKILASARNNVALANASWFDRLERDLAAYHETFARTAPPTSTGDTEEVDAHLDISGSADSDDVMSPIVPTISTLEFWENLSISQTDDVDSGYIDCELKLDPLAIQIDGEDVACAQCGDVFQIRQWKSHCRSVHSRLRSEQWRLTSKGRWQALRAKHGRVVDLVLEELRLDPLANAAFAKGDMLSVTCTSCTWTIESGLTSLSSWREHCLSAAHGRTWREQQRLIAQAEANVNSIGLGTGPPVQTNPTSEAPDQIGSGGKRPMDVDAELPRAKRPRVESPEVVEEDDDDWAFGPPF